MYKDVSTHITEHVTSHARSPKNEEASLMEMDVPSIPCEKISIDVWGPFNKTTTENINIISFLGRVKNWVDSYSLRDKNFKRWLN